MINKLINLLVKNDWIFVRSKKFEDCNNFFPKMIPTSVRSLCSSFDELASPAENIWFFSQLDYTGRSDSAFKWNEFELNGLTCAMDGKQKNEVSLFWARYFPFAMSVKNDYKYLAIGIDANNFGEIFVGENSDENEILIVANNFEEFVDLLGKFYSGNRGESLDDFFM